MKQNISFSSVLAELDMIKAEIDCREKLMNVYHIFESNYNIPGIIVMKKGIFYRMLSKSRFYQVMSKQYMFDLFSRRAIQFFFDDKYDENYLVLNDTVTIIEAAGKALQRDDLSRYEPVIVLTNSGEYKLLPIHNLLLAQNEIQTGMIDIISEANEFKKDVLRIVAHDLRNPLAAVIGFANLITEKQLDYEKTHLFASQIYFAANNMNDLINDFLVAAINDSTDFDIHFSIFNLSVYIEKIISGFNNSLQAKKQELIYQPSDINVMINADRNKIAEVIENLISNAIKYSGYEKKIIVDVSCENEMALIKVQDEGPGFTEQDLQKIFKKFQKLSAKPTGNESSTGLGLYIAKRIMDKHNGKIWLESKLGEGTTFYISLPVYCEDIIIENKEKTLSI